LIDLAHVHLLRMVRMALSVFWCLPSLRMSCYNFHLGVEFGGLFLFGHGCVFSISPFASFRQRFTAGSPSTLLRREVRTYGRCNELGLRHTGGMVGIRYGSLHVQNTKECSRGKGRAPSTLAAGLGHLVLSYSEPCLHTQSILGVMPRASRGVWTSGRTAEEPTGRQTAGRPWCQHD